MDRPGDSRHDQLTNRQRFAANGSLKTKLRDETNGQFAGEPPHPAGIT
jgi:hypothetical protein